MARWFAAAEAGIFCPTPPPHDHPESMLAGPTPTARALDQIRAAYRHAAASTDGPW